MIKPDKITTNIKKFFSIVEKKIKDGKYIFTHHAEKRSSERQILDEEVLNILENKPRYSRRWVKSKDTFESPYYSAPSTWRYCIEGKTPDDDLIRIIIAFDEELMPIITVIRLGDKR
jgi:hypothetical protein